MNERDRRYACVLGSDCGGDEKPIEHDHVGAPVAEQFDILPCRVPQRCDRGIAHSFRGAKRRARLPVAYRVGLRMRDVEVGKPPADRDELSPSALDPLARGAVGQDAHLVAPLDELPCER